ncbi:DNA polymerase III subunit beta [Chrysiogenes arsenatis]|uniref:DNA polymerase III subunit beta n=1 Tax=Chrysiogenes arsenatis TaxID=309797 RepID=UPI0004158B28|nr:DNA polymerase III subunit beta [Chrysiogenes arsenatis]
MRFEIEKKDLEKGLFKASGICSSKNITNNILTNVHLVATDGKLQIHSTDRNISLTSTISANILENGSILTNGKKFYEAIKELPNNIVIVESTDNVLQVICRKSNFKLLTSHASLFPESDITQDTESSTFKVPAKILSDLITKTVFCSCEGQSRYGVSGVLLKTQNNTLTTVATDGHRLAVYAVPTTEHQEQEVIIPRNCIPEIIKVISDTEEDIEIIIEQNSMILKTNNDILKTTILKKKFPLYEKVIPTECPIEIVLDNKAFKDAIKRLAIFSNNDASRTIKFTATDSSIITTIQSPEFGNAKETIDIESNSSESQLEVGFNLRYLTDIIHHIEFEKVKIRFNEGCSVSMFLPETTESNTKPFPYYILMPNRL